MFKKLLKKYCVTGAQMMNLVLEVVPVVKREALQ
jgi:hypothetical protein